MQHQVLTWFMRIVFATQLGAALFVAHSVSEVDGWRFLVGSFAVAALFLMAYMNARIAYQNMVLI